MNSRLRILCLLGLIALLGAGTVQSSAAPDSAAGFVRYDGLYRAHPGGGTQTLFLRFYPDGYVIAMSFMGTSKAVAQFINRSHEALPHGQYTIAEGVLSFTTHTPRGDIEYAGKHVGDLIVFHIHSKITEFVSDEPFGFIAVKFPDNDAEAKPTG